MNITIRPSILGLVARCSDCETTMREQTSAELRVKIALHQCAMPVVELDENQFTDYPANRITITMHSTRFPLTLTTAQAESLAADLTALLHRRRRMVNDSDQATRLAQPLDADEQEEADAQAEQDSMLRERP